MVDVILYLWKDEIFLWELVKFDDDEFGDVLKFVVEIK